MPDPDDPMNVHDYTPDQLRELLIIERRNYKELSTAHAERLKRVDALREEKLLVESQLQSALAKLETIDRINKAVRKPAPSKDEVLVAITEYFDAADWEQVVIKTQLEETKEKIQQLKNHLPDDADLQLICLALAELALHRPGMDYAATCVAEKIGGELGKQHIAQFKVTSADLAKPYEEFKRIINRGSDPSGGPAAGG